MAATPPDQEDLARFAANMVAVAAQYAKLGYGILKRGAPGAHIVATGSTWALFLNDRLVGQFDADIKIYLDHLVHTVDPTLYQDYLAFWLWGRHVDKPVYKQMLFVAHMHLQVAWAAGKHARTLTQTDAKALVDAFSIAFPFYGLIDCTDTNGLWAQPDRKDARALIIRSSCLFITDNIGKKHFDKAADNLAACHIGHEAPAPVLRQFEKAYRTKYNVADDVTLFE